ncbi:hypothetical protein J3E64_000560 [Sphingobium sp. OAS761]|uniref:PilZ domain-containing protein n=1 Tax=Sphingobium sp. OAS761 TaxID=2817901 RepID=UPI0020A1F040|nr:PilZ domain-containing protein [Sphingobium sp. OAS761]MCP1468889.1 hypothetical protein [Sphingobium sp. OAS761]
MQDRYFPTVSFEQTRRATRHKLFEPVTLRMHGFSVRAHLLDLSETGALGHSDQPPYDGDHVIIEGGILCATGHIVWVRGKKFGVRFDTPLAPQKVLGILDDL